MRIFLSCLQSLRRHQVPAYEYWETYFKRGIREGGHSFDEAPDVDWAEGLTYTSREDAAAWRERTWQRVVDQLRANPVDLVLTYLYPVMVDESAVAHVRSMGIPWVNFFCDNVRQFRRVPKEYFGFDLNWVPELAATRMYGREGVPYVHAAMPTWVDPSLRTCNHEESFPPTFIGSRDSTRETLFADALALGANIELRGAGWQGAPAPAARPSGVGAGAGPTVRLRRQVADVGRYGVRGYARKLQAKFRRPVSDELFAAYVRSRPSADEYVRITQQSVVTLGVNRYPSYWYPADRPDTYSRGRDIEAPMMGACYLTEWTEELDGMYDVGADIETYRTPGELVAKLRMLEANPARRKSMRCLAQKRALAEHSVPASLERIARRLGLPRT